MAVPDDRARGIEVRTGVRAEDVRVVTYPESEVPRHLRLQMVMLQDEAWPSSSEPTLAPWHDPALDPLSVLLLDGDDAVLSTLDILSKEIAHKGETYRASGISAMVTRRDARRSGFGRVLAREARDVMAERRADIGIFTCDSSLRPFYEASGWEGLPGTVLIGGTPADPFPSDRFDKVTMACFFSRKARAAKADFVQGRVELYPGEIDKLW